MNGGTRLMFPGLAEFYARMAPIAYTLLRVTVGATIFVHGWVKITGPGVAGITRYFTGLGLPAPGLLAYWAIFIETFGAACIVVGLFTRFFAAAVAIEMLVAVLTVHWANGFLVSANPTAPKNGYEFALLLGVALFAIAIRGGGPYSADAKIGKEL